MKIEFDNISRDHNTKQGDLLENVIFVRTYMYLATCVLANSYRLVQYSYIVISNSFELITYFLTVYCDPYFLIQFQKV